MELKILIINDADNVGVALEDIPAGAVLTLPLRGELVAATDIPLSHKVALEDLAQGAPLIKYGETIGRAGVQIKVGEWVHTHNLETEEPA